MVSRRDRRQDAFGAAALCQRLERRVVLFGRVLHATDRRSSACRDRRRIFEPRGTECVPGSGRARPAQQRIKPCSTPEFRRRATPRSGRVRALPPASMPSRRTLWSPRTDGRGRSHSNRRRRTPRRVGKVPGLLKHLRARLETVIDWNSRTRYGYGCGPTAEPSRSRCRSDPRPSRARPRRSRHATSCRRRARARPRHPAGACGRRSAPGARHRPRPCRRRTAYRAVRRPQRSRRRADPRRSPRRCVSRPPLGAAPADRVVDLGRARVARSSRWSQTRRPSA